MANSPSLLSDNWFVFTGSGGIAIFVVSISAVALINGDEPSYLIWLMYVGLALFFASIIIWGLYRLLRRFGKIEPTPRDLQQVQSDLEGLQEQLDSVDNLDERVSELERELKEKDLNEAGDVYIVEESEIKIQR
jgi:hypothetical protein